MCFPRFDADLGLVPAIILCILIVSAISCYNSLFVVGRERAGEMWISDFGKFGNFLYNIWLYGIWFMVQGQRIPKMCNTCGEADIQR